MRGILSSNQRLARIAPRIFLCGTIILCIAIGLVAGLTVAQAAETASLPANAQNIATPLPDILSKADRSRYKKIFDIQERGDWHRADRLIKKLDNKVLLGHIQAQRYLHPTKYRSR